MSSFIESSVISPRVMPEVPENNSVLEQGLKKAAIGEPVTVESPINKQPTPPPGSSSIGALNGGIKGLPLTSEKVPLLIAQNARSSSANLTLVGQVGKNDQRLPGSKIVFTEQNRFVANDRTRSNIGQIEVTVNRNFVNPYAGTSLDTPQSRKQIPEVVVDINDKQRNSKFESRLYTTIEVYKPGASASSEKLIRFYQVVGEVNMPGNEMKVKSVPIQDARVNNGQIQVQQQNGKWIDISQLARQQGMQY